MKDGMGVEGYRSAHEFVAPMHFEAASTLAVVASSREPLVFLAADLRVIAASASFCRDFQIDPANVPGRPLAELGAGEWALPELNSLLLATLTGREPIEAYELDFFRKGAAPRNLVLNASRLEDGEIDRVRLLLAITDVTQARAEARHTDDLIRENAILLQEIQHRVANSLQIIASVLMQSARKVQSEEARGHLEDAHHRVLSIASIQRHLSQTRLGDVALHPYLAQLCEILGASMIGDPTRISIVVTADATVVDANASISLGLVTTELVINAIKHAFPNGQPGKISVDFQSDGDKWTLSVKDDGVGMPKGEIKPKPGLGSGIIAALAKQLRGKIEVTDMCPGTAFSLVGAGEAGGERPVIAAL